LDFLDQRPGLRLLTLRVTDPRPQEPDLSLAKRRLAGLLAHLLTFRTLALCFRVLSLRQVTFAQVQPGLPFPQPCRGLVRPAEVKEDIPACLTERHRPGEVSRLEIERAQPIPQQGAVIVGVRQCLLTPLETAPGLLPAALVGVQNAEFSIPRSIPPCRNSRASYSVIKDSDRRLVSCWRYPC
jgi:hypothetical protein